MRNISKTNTYSDIYGNRYTQGQVNAIISDTKRRKIQEQLDESGYNFCEDCGKNAASCGKLDCSHDISVDKLKCGHVEMLRETKYITMRCRKCHDDHG